ncbi:hypothetical protein [Nonomuraea ceibae]|uniref:hypothetical protein n=1 Tax=Nonomuraea ceibae TaxID=1935170 RepID=UPI001C5E289A|nr:hypothetical protein [Nonomuraea ceibae]
MSAPRCDHRSADPKMCADCRDERLHGRPVPPLADVVALLADTTPPAATGGPVPMIDPTHADYARTLSADLQHLCGRIGWSALPTEDLRALVRSAVYGVPPASDVIVRVSEALAEAPELRLVRPTDVQPD